MAKKKEISLIEKKTKKRELLVKKLVSEAKLPTKAYAGDLGWDLYSAEDVVIEPREIKAIRTGIAVQLPAGFGAFIKDRSSRAKMGLHCIGGVIDNGYRGEIIVLITNLSRDVVKIKKGEKIAQLVLISLVECSLKEVDELGTSERGNRGFGSSGR